MATVLVTGVGGAGGIGAIRSLQAETTHDVVGVDMDPTAAGLYLADDGRTVPPATADDWVDEMVGTVDAFGVDVVVPLVDEELPRLPTLAAALDSDVSIVAPRPAVVDLTLDKWHTSRRLAADGHTVPETWLASEADTIDRADFPLQVKPRRGRGSRGAERVDTPAGLNAYLDASDHAPEELVVQRYVEGTEYTTSVVVTEANRLLAVVPKEALEKDGSTVRGVTRHNQAVVDSCRRLFETLAPAGPMNVQQIVDDTDTPHTIEINPRFSSTACLTVGAGVDEFDLLIRDALGEAVTAPEGYTSGLHIRRYMDHVLVPETELQSSGRDGDDADSS